MFFDLGADLAFARVEGPIALLEGPLLLEGGAFSLLGGDKPPYGRQRTEVTRCQGQSWVRTAANRVRTPCLGAQARGLEATGLLERVAALEEHVPREGQAAESRDGTTGITLNTTDTPGAR